MLKKQYLEQSQLLLKCLPYIAKHSIFALKGGTAINLFYCDMPRLSIDIDLTYVPIKDRDQSLSEISYSLLQIKKDIEKNIFGTKINEIKTFQNNLTKLRILSNFIEIKIEVNEVLRGTVYMPELLNIRQKVQKDLNVNSISMLVSSFYDVYAGKICAALDRQHPRDLFDIHMFLNHHQIDNKLMECFLIYLICGSRPIHEILKPNMLDINQSFIDEFSGMTSTKINHQILYKARTELINLINNKLTMSNKQFLLSFKSGDPNWNLINIKHAHELPAIKWKLSNISKMNKQKHKISIKKLEEVLKLNQ